MPEETVLGPATVICRTPDLMATELDDITVMFRAEKEKYYGFETVGSRIWQLLEAPTTVAALCDVLLQEFDVSREQCEQETLDFVRQLHAEDLVVLRDETAR